MAEQKEQFNTAAESETVFGELDGSPAGYVPLPTNVPGQAEGSLWLANFRDSTTIGSFLSSNNSKALDRDALDIPMQEIIENIPEDKLNFADRYIGRRLEDFPEITSSIEREQNDKALIAAHPIKSFGIGLFEQPLDPVNWLPFGAIYKNVNRGSRLTRSIIGSGATAAAAAGVQEAIIQRNQESREAQESVFNVATSGLLGATLGGIGTGLSIRGRLKSIEQRKARRKLKSEIMDVYTDNDKQLSPEGILTGEQLANMPKSLQKTMLSTPMNRLLKSDFGISKWFSNRMYENNYTLEKNLDGQATDIPVERLIRQDHRKLERVLTDYDDIFYSLNGISKGPFRATRAKLQDAQWTKQDFDLAVWETLSTDVPHENEHVNRAAELMRNEVFEPAKNRLIDAGQLPEDVRPGNAANYVMSVWNKDLIIEQGGKKARGGGTLPDTLHKEFKAIQEKIKAFKESPLFKQNTRKLNQAEERLASLEEQKKGLPKTQKAKLKKLTENIKRAKEEIEQRKKNIRNAAPQEGLDSDGELFPILGDEELWGRVEQTIDNILGDNEGKLLNPILQRLKTIGSKPLKERKMTVEQVKLREWQITNMPKIAGMYTRATSPIVHMTEFAQKNGFKDVQELKTFLEEQIKQDFDEQSKGKTGAEAQKLRKQRDSNISDMTATFELLEGVYGDGPNTMNNTAKKYYQNFMKWNATRLLGFMTMSSFPDAGIQVMTHGPYRFIHDGLVRSLSEMRNVTKQDLRAIGYAMETELGSRLKSYSDTQGLSTNPGVFTRGLDALTKNFGNLSMMNQWNNLMQSIAGHIGINRTLQTIHAVVKGEKVPQKEITRLNKLGLDRKHFKTIFEFTKNNVDTDGAIFADWTNWDIKTKAQREALEQFQATVGKEIDNIVIVPGLGDKPLAAQSAVGKLLLQFKSFLMAATNRVLVSGIQNKNDINTWLGVTSMLSLGAMSYVATTLVRGNEPDFSFENLSKEAIDKSGLLGIYGEFANIGAKIFGYQGSSRYQSRDVVGGFMGPAFGAASEVISVLQKTAQIAEGEAITTRDADKFLRLLPLQNLAPLHQINRKIARGAAKELGAIDED